MMIGDNSISVYFYMLFLHGLDIVCILQSLPIFYVILQYEAEYAFSCCVPPERGVTLSSLLLLFLQNKLINRFNFPFPSHVLCLIAVSELFRCLSIEYLPMIQTKISASMGERKFTRILVNGV